VNPAKAAISSDRAIAKKTDRRMVAVPREQCVAMAGTIELPLEPQKISKIQLSKIHEVTHDATADTVGHGGAVARFG